MDILLFQIAIVLGLLVFITPMKYKYWSTVLPMSLMMIISTKWAIDVILFDIIKSQVLSFNINSLPIHFWFQLPSIKIDQLSALFIMMINIVTLGAMIYAKDYLNRHEHKKGIIGMSMHYYSLFILYMSLILLTMIRDGFMFLFLWELMSLSSFVLLAFDGERENIRKISLNYIIQMHIGFFLILAGFLIAYKKTGVFGFEALPIYFQTEQNLFLFLMFFVGFGFKTGLIPFHTWAPHSDSVAPPHVSSIMSGILVKLGIFGILRVSSELQSSYQSIGVILTVVSLISILFAISMSVYQNDLRKLLAYSSIENMGVICLGISLSILGKAYNMPSLSVLGMMGALLHIISHSLYKSMLFLLTGNIQAQAGTRNINELGGLSKKMPLTTVFFLIGSLSLCALPPFNGFVSEFMMYKGVYNAITKGEFFVSILSIIIVLTMALSGGLSLYTMTKAFGLSFLGSARTKYKSDISEKLSIKTIPMIMNTFLMLCLGLAPVIVFPETFQTLSIFKFINVPTDFQMDQIEIFKKFGYLSMILLLVFFTLYFIRSRQQKTKTIEYGPTWGCGYQGGDAKHQYTGTTYASPMKRILSPIYHEENEYYSLHEEEIFPQPRKFHTKVSDKIEKFIILKPIILLLKVVPKVGLAQTGRIQHYLIYPLAFLITIVVLSIFNLI